MRYIRKLQNIPYYLNNQRPPENAKKAESSWSRFKHKRRLSERLNVEQYELCAYSELRPDEEGRGTHIEHVKPKGLYPEETFNYYNIVLSALSSEELQGMDQDSIFGGHAKQSQYDDRRFVSCLTPGCQEYFRYLSNGRVVPAHSLSRSQTENADYTIDLLKLNCEYLKNRRKKCIEELEEAMEDIPDDRLEDLADGELGMYRFSPACYSVCHNFVINSMPKK
ncbi:MAG TPA: TIGR02646 family protein [Desulfobacterales bacterium]|nr:TIGR02646 family protein [Desulfobacterales bacterium]